MKRYKGKISFTIRRVKGFLKLFVRNKRGIIGAGILIFFIFLALAAPLLTPHDPIRSYYDPALGKPTTFKAGDFAVPSWFKQLNMAGNLSENLSPLAESFSTNSSLPGYGNSSKFVFSHSSEHVSLQYDSSMGYSNPGSARITFERGEDTPPAGEVVVELTTRFYYPFDSPPKRFTFRIGTLTTGTGLVQETWQGNFTYLDVQPKMKIFIEQVGGETVDLWQTVPLSWGPKDPRYVGPRYILWDNTRLPTPPNYRMIIANATKWVPMHGLDSYDSQVLYTLFNPAKPDPKANIIHWEGIIFPKQGEYILGIEISFIDGTQNTNKNVTTTVYVDDVYSRFFGTTWGLLGTDQYGRDIFTQLLYGARVSLYVGLLSAALSVVIGLVVGLTSGYLGGIWDEIIMRATDMLLVLPGLPFLLVLMAVLGQSMQNLIILIGVLGWMGFARVVRSQVLSLKERPFIEAAKAVGAGKVHIIARHVLPNVMSLVYVTLALSVPSAILMEAAISWLGWYDPHVMSWGRMLYDITFWHAYEKWWWVLPPGLCIAAVSLSFILLGYALDEILNPKLRVRR